MQKELLDSIWIILKKNYTDDNIISISSSLSKHKDIKVLEESVYKYFLNPEIDLKLKEKTLSGWLGKFLNQLKFVNYDLELFSKIYDDLNNLLSSYKYRVDVSPDYDMYYTVVTPTEIKEVKDFEESYYDDSERYDDELRASEKWDEFVAKYNQKLLIQFVGNSETYIKILKSYFDGNQITILSEKTFIKSILGMQESIYKLSLGINQVNVPRFRIIVPFESLYTLKTDWELATFKDSKNDWLDTKIIRNTEFNFENIKSLLGPILKKMTTLIDENNISSEQNYLDYCIYFSVNKNELFYKGNSKVNKASPIMPYLLKSLFSNPKEVKIISEVLEEAKMDDTTKNTTIRDSIKQINSILKDMGLSEKVFSYRADKVFTDEKYLNRLKIK